MGKVRKTTEWALREFLRPVVAVWALCGGRERRRKKLEARIIAAIIDGMGRNEPMPSLTKPNLHEKDPRC